MPLGRASMPAMKDKKDLVPVPEAKELASLASGNDPLTIYLREISRIPLLTPEQEYALALRLFSAQDLEAARQLVRANLRLVVKIAMEYRHSYQNMLDLIQEGNVGLMKGVSKFDPHKGVKLSTYVSVWIRSYVLKFLIDNFRMVRVSTTKAHKKLFYNLMKEREKLEAQGIVAQPKMLAEKLNVDESEVLEMGRRLSAGDDMSLESPWGSSEGASGGRSVAESIVVEDQLTPEVVSEGADLIRRLRSALPQVQAQLSSREKWVLDNRIMAEEPKTLQEVADEFKVSRERARQIEAEIIAKIRVVFGRK